MLSLKDGYKIINTCDAYLYIVPAAGYYRDFLDTKWLYEQWRVGKVNPKEELPEGTPGLLGGMFAVWNDHCGNGVSQQDVHFRTFPAAQVLAEKMWRGKNEWFLTRNLRNCANRCLKLPVSTCWGVCRVR